MATGIPQLSRELSIEEQQRVFTAMQSGAVLSLEDVPYSDKEIENVYSQPPLIGVGKTAVTSVEEPLLSLE